LANGSATLAAYADNAGSTLTAQAGSVSLTSQTGPIDWTTVNAATTFEATATAGGVTLGPATSGATQTIGATGNIGFTTLTSTGGDIVVTSTGGSIVGASPGHALDAHGAFTLNAATTISGTVLTAETGDGSVIAGGAIDLGTTNAATTLGVRSTAGGITLGSATSGATQTIGATGNIVFAQLTSTGGDIGVTSTGGSIAGASPGDTLDAHGAFTLNAATTISGTVLTAETGDGSVTAGGAIDLGTTNVATTLGVSSTAGGVTLGSATSGATQTIMANGAIGFTTLRTNAGDIDATSQQSSITGVTLRAQGSASLSAYGDNKGSTLTTETGSALLTSKVGQIDWTNLNVATTLTANAAAGGIAFNSALSGGTQTLTAQHDIVFSNLTTTGTATDPGDVNLRAIVGAARGGSIHAHGSASIDAAGIYFSEIDVLGGLNMTSSADITGNSFSAEGSVVVDAAGTVSLTSANGADLVLATPGSITMDNLTVSTAVDFAAANLNLGVLSQAPNMQGPLELTLTGYGGGVGQSASVTIDAPNGLIIPQLRETTASITTNALQIAMGDPTISKTMRLATPDQILWFNDVSSQPVLGVNVQFYQPSHDFFVDVDNRSIQTDSYIVQYDAAASVQQFYNGSLINGPSFVRDFGRLDETGNEGDPTLTSDDLSGPWYFPVEKFDRHLAAMNARLMSKTSAGPAVNLEGAAFTVLFTRTRQ
jgi:hypothetical protein